MQRVTFVLRNLLVGRLHDTRMYPLLEQKDRYTGHGSRRI